MTDLIFSNQASVLKKVTFSKIVFDIGGSPDENWNDGVALWIKPIFF